jgi:hypothetical protein
MYAYLLDVLAGKLRDELLETVTLSVDTDGREDGLDVLGRGLLVAGEVEEEVGCEVLHFGCLDARKNVSQRVVVCAVRKARVLARFLQDIERNSQELM